MKYILLVTVFCLTSLISLNVSAQESLIDDVNYTQLEEYIALAKANYPRSKIMALNEKKSKDLVPMAALDIFNMVNASYYYRPSDKVAINPENPYVFNGIQYGIGVSLGTLVQKPFQIKQAKIDREIAKLEKADYEKTLVTEVKNRYYLYIYQLKELKLRTQAAQDAQVIADGVSLRFERGEVEMTDYTTAKTNLNSAISAKIQIEMTYLIAKDQLEEIIGKKLTEVGKN